MDFEWLQFLGRKLNPTLESLYICGSIQESRSQACDIDVIFMCTDMLAMPTKIVTVENGQLIDANIFTRQLLLFALHQECSRGRCALSEMVSTSMRVMGDPALHAELTQVARDFMHRSIEAQKFRRDEVSSLVAIQLHELTKSTSLAERFINSSKLYRTIETSHSILLGKPYVEGKHLLRRVHSYPGASIVEALANLIAAGLDDAAMNHIVRITYEWLTFHSLEIPKVFLELNRKT